MADREAKAAVADEVALAAQALPADGTEETARMATTVCPAGPAMGGQITLIYDPQVTPFLSVIHLPKSDGPKPIIREEPVAQLW
jgi:hypothetical protein